MICSVTGKPVKDVLSTFFKDRNDVSESEVKKFHLLATFEECRALAVDTARRMNEYYKDVAEPVTLVALLTGAYLYASLLTVHLTFPYTLHFVKVSSYKGKRQESVVFDEEDLKQLKEKREVVLIDEYVDSGHTIFSIQEQIKHAKICSCFVKDVDAIKKHPALADTKMFYGYTPMPKGSWLIGFGLDDNGLRRGWAHLFDINLTESEVAEFRRRLAEHIRGLNIDGVNRY
ncbi:Guanine phosphoribosyltransferase [Giardia lamblia P15]|uniref:Guanine phosphoribosyltransferase n=1 Tax=Giardia intestinalis (strain P15) TaxID=658858 RepID=E1F0F3_GIAIA|nr:Guanine phosphoribosyltransferase [Giardia lamblia P15]